MPDFSYQGNSAVSLNPKTSGLAIASLVLGIVTLPTIFICLGIVTGTIGIILGIVSLFTIRGSKGRIKGKWIGITGIFLSCAAFIIYGVFINKLRNNPTEIIPDSPAVAAMKRAESNITTSSASAARGNSTEAIALAAAYSKLLDELNREYFVSSKESHGPSLTGGKFLVHCQLKSESCAFLVHVPSYRKYEGEGKVQLAQLAWIAAQRVVADAPGVVPQGSDLGIGLRGVLLYGAVMTGTADASADDPESLLDYNGQDEDHLEPFFDPGEKNLPVFDTMPGEELLMPEEEIEPTGAPEQ